MPPEESLHSEHNVQALRDFYVEHDDSKCDEVDNILHSFGKDEQNTLVNMLFNKYNDRPAFEEAPVPQTEEALTANSPSPPPPSLPPEEAAAEHETEG